MINVSKYFVGYEFVKEKSEKYGFSNGRLKKRLDADYDFSLLLQGDNVTLTVIDENFEDEIVNYENPTYIKNLWEKEIESVRTNCCVKLKYMQRQANRIDNYIETKYGTSAEFLWDKSPSFGVYRNTDNRKWFAIIMDIGYNSLDKNRNGIVNIINLKSSFSDDFFEKPGFYPAYHMNKKNWITVVLDGTVEESVIEDLIDKSYNTVNENRKKPR